MALMGLALGGCPGAGGSASAAAAATAGGDDDENPDSLELAGWELPARPHDVHFDEGPLAEGATLARDTIRDARPALDAGATPTEMHAYVDGALHEWLMRRARAVRDARVALGSAEEEGR